MITNIPADKLLKADRPRAFAYAILSKPAENYAEIADYRPMHLAYLADLDHAGQLMAAGPLLDPTGKYYRGAGLIVVRCNGVADAQKLAENDPFHQRRIRKFELMPWLLSEGDLFNAERKRELASHG